ncbi:MAG: murein hydrolase activator EnvC family protein [Ilumatobacteraceae bacterium]
MRRVLCLFAAVCFFGPLLSTTVGRADDTDAQKAAKEIADARDRANAAADAYFASESKIDQLTVQENQLQSEITALEGDVKALKLSVENVAIGRYTRSGSTGVPLLTGFQSPEDQVKIDALLNVIYDSSANDFDRFDALNADLADKRQKLADKKDQAEKERANLAVLKDQAAAEVQRLKAIETDRLKDQAVRDALVAEQARRKRDTDRKRLLDAPTPEAVAPIDTTVTMPGNAASDNSGDSGDGLSAGVATRPSLPDAGGGQTGGGGMGSFFGGGANDYGGPGWVCPTGAAAAPFADTWGAPRSGGRRHQGVDMIGQRGIPVVAVVDGVAEPHSNVLGGTTIWLTGADGNGYYYAHLDGYAQLGTVKAGTTIGFLGQTGNAQFSIAHLHFEIHPGEGPAVNPYPTVAAHCPSPGPATG